MRGDFRAIRGGVAKGGAYRMLNMPRVSVYNNTGPIIPNAADTIITWDTKEYDEDSMWVSGTKITAGTAGIWLVNLWGEWAAAAGGVRQMRLTKNVTADVLIRSNIDAASAGTTAHGLSRPVPMNAGDYLEVVVAQSSGGGLQFNGATLAARANGLTATLLSTIG
jgi:hypothetical protein